MRSLSALSIVSLGVALTSGTHAQVAASKTPPPEAFIDPPDPVLEQSKLARRSLPKAAEVRAAVKADPRVAPLSAKIKGALEIADKTQRKAALDALGPQIVAIRTDIMKRFPPPEGSALTVLSPKTEPPALSPGPTPGSASWVTVTSFPREYTFKRDCPNSEDTWKLFPSVIKIAAASYPLDNDCMTIRAGRSAMVLIPEGTKKLIVKVSADVGLSAFAAAFGIHAHAEARWGIRLRATNGAGLDEILIAGKPTPVPVKIVNYRVIRARNFAPSPVPFEHATFNDTTHEGDNGGASIGIDVPSSVGGSTVEVSVWTGGFADADVTGVAQIVTNVVVRSMTVSFVK